MLTAEGEPTTDPKKAEILLPLGGPKGSGLGLMFEMLASILAAAPIQSRALGPEQRTRHVANLAMLAIDIESFRPLADFEHDADALVAVLKSLPRQQGFDEVTMPGERSGRTEAGAAKNGIPIPAKLWEELEEIAKAHAVKMPAMQRNLKRMKTPRTHAMRSARALLRRRRRPPAPRRPRSMNSTKAKP